MELKATFAANGRSTATVAFPAERYGEQLRLEGTFGAIVLPTSVTDCNFDPRYPMFVERTAVWENAEGTITAYELLGADETVAARGTADMTVSGRAVLCVRIALEWDGEEVWPTYPENALVKWLLGCADRPTFTVGLGHDRRRFDRPVRRDATALVTAPATVTATDDGLQIGCSFADGSFDDELLLLADGAPVLRGPIGKLLCLSKSFARQTVRGKYCAIDAYNAVSLNRVQFGGKTVTGRLLKRDGRASPPERVDLRVPAGAWFGSGGAYLGILSHDEITVLKNDRGLISVYRNVAAFDAAADITDDGTLVVAAEGTLTLYLPDGSERAYSMEKPDKLVALGSSAALHIGALYGTTLKRYRVNLEMMATVETVTDVTFVGRAGLKLVYGNETQAFAKTLDASDAVAAAFAQTALYECGGNATAGAGFIYAAGVAYDLETGARKTGFDFCCGLLPVGNGKVWTRDYSAVGFGELCDLPAGTTAVGRMDDCIVGLDADGLWQSTVEEGKAVVYSDAFDNGTANCSLIVGANINEDGGECSYAFRLTF